MELSELNLFITGGSNFCNYIAKYVNKLDYICNERI